MKPLETRNISSSESPIFHTRNATRVMRVEITKTARLHSIHHHHHHHPRRHHHHQLV